MLDMFHIAFCVVVFTDLGQRYLGQRGGGILVQTIVIFDVWSPQRSHILGDISFRGVNHPCPSAVSNTVRSLVAKAESLFGHSYDCMPGLITSFHSECTSAGGIHLVGIIRVHLMIYFLEGTT